MSSTAAMAPPACDRCGAIAALRIRLYRRLCAECFERTRSGVETAPPTAMHLVRGTFEVLAAVWFPATLAASAVALPAAVLTALLPLPVALLWLGREFWSLAGAVVVLELGLRAVHRDDPQSFSPVRASTLGSALSRWPALALIHALAIPAVLLASILLVLPGVYLSLGFALAFPAVMRGEEGGLAALKRSTLRMKGHRVQLLLAMMVLAVPAIFVVMTAGVGAATVLGLVIGREASAEPGIVRAAAVLLGDLIRVPFLLLLLVLDAKLRYAASAARVAVLS